MTNVESFASREQLLNKAIDQKVEDIRCDGEFELPKSDDLIVGDYIRKIEGTYDVTRAKKDTDNAVDLLYIAYNATPQKVDEIRVKISSIMDRLITAQQDSERTMRRALMSTSSIVGALDDFCPDWLDAKDGEIVDDIKEFVTGGFRDLAKEIQEKADEIREELDVIAATYDEIIADTVDATALSETALGKEIKAKEQLEQEIAEANAERERLESLVSDLQDQVDKFDKMARDFESRAETAEERAFVMSIVRVAAQTIAAAIPPIAMAASGPGSFLAASSMNAMSNGNSGNSGSDDGENTEKTIETKNKISEEAAKLRKSEEKRNELKQKIKDLKVERDKLIAADEAAKPDEAGASEEDGEDPDADTPDVDAADKATEEPKASENPEIEALNQRIADAEAELADEEDNGYKIGAMLAGLNASLQQLDQSLAEMTDEQQSQAANLREMQMKMLDKVEAYEKERRKQAAELVKINALLRGKRTQEETYTLAIKSLNLSISALKKTKEIIVEISFFFKSFSDFMGQVSTQATEQINSVDRVADRDTIKKRALARLLKSTDEFFIRQTAQWHAAANVSDKFVQNFADGWSKLNKLSGKYINGDELDAYLAAAAVKLAEISADREAAAGQRIADLDKYRNQILYGETGS